MSRSSYSKKTDKLKISKMLKEYFRSRLIFFFSLYLYGKSWCIIERLVLELQEVPLNVSAFLACVLVSKSRAWFY